MGGSLIAAVGVASGERYSGQCPGALGGPAHMRPVLESMMVAAATQFAWILVFDMGWLLRSVGG